MIRRSYERVIRDRKTNKQEKQNEIKHKAKQRLVRAITKKFQTCFIGSVDSVEHHFGVLWGKDQKETKTSFQLKVAKRWQELRTEMLDKGNSQLRAMLKELEEYDIDWIGHNLEIEIGDK